MLECIRFRVAIPELLGAQCRPSTDLLSAGTGAKGTTVWHNSHPPTARPYQGKVPRAEVSEWKAAILGLSLTLALTSCVLQMTRDFPYLTKSGVPVKAPPELPPRKEPKEEQE